MTTLVLLDYGSVLIFALTGALVASRAQLDPVGFAFVACLTAVGGGTIRDLLLGAEQIFWIKSPSYILLAVAAALLVFFTAHFFESRYRVLLWLDSVALSVAVAAGAGVAISLDQNPVIVVLMGICTGCMGGLMRDVVCNEVPLVLKHGEIYVTAAFAGACAAVIGLWSAIDGLPLLLICAVVTWTLRAGSLRFGWRLPGYRAHPPRKSGS